ncbi:extensin family protein [Sphingomonas donggukensis]|uniref:Extensin family protein n=1 Tax=Sphingomonas donggukensis TaxID=2949093 RepID=A0ABY4TX76_9SPHN|nr:extensin family protein [Sphingomonas donggukensis]URW77003.1 extensin family protein [Sphingomonas donggukensis]
MLLAIGFAIYAFVKSRPQDLPWTPLDLAEKPGMFTSRKLAALGDDFAGCRALLEKAGVRHTALAPVTAQGGQCGYADGVRVTGGAARLRYVPVNLGVACPVAAGMAMLEWNVIQPAAERHFGERVRSVEHFGSYNCRRLYGRGSGDWSQHATADAIDLAGFVLADGRRISVVRDWSGQDAKKAAFLRDVRDGACGLFTTVLSPDYNAAHRDHFHLDQANRGMMGWRACR